MRLRCWAGRSILMRNWISLQAELGNFQHRKTIFSFALKMSFLAIILSGFILAVALPSLDFFGLLPLPLPHAVRFGVILSWLVGGTVSPTPPNRMMTAPTTVTAAVVVRRVPPEKLDVLGDRR